MKCVLGHPVMSGFKWCSKGPRIILDLKAWGEHEGLIFLNQAHDGPGRTPCLPNPDKTLRGLFRDLPYGIERVKVCMTCPYLSKRSFVVRIFLVRLEDLHPWEIIHAVPKVKPTRRVLVPNRLIEKADEGCEVFGARMPDVFKKMEPSDLSRGKIIRHFVDELHGLFSIYRPLPLQIEPVPSDKDGYVPGFG